MKMKAIAALTLVLVLGLLGLGGPLAPAQDKKADAPKLEGQYQLVAGKKNGMAIDDESKKAAYTFTADKIRIEGGDVKFVMGYTLDTTAKPVKIDMEILEGPEGTKGAMAQGIVEVTGDTVKIAYSVEKDKRPGNFEGKEGFYFELKKLK